MSESAVTRAHPRGRALRRVLRAVPAAGLVLAIVYAALPWLIPGSVVARHLSETLTRTMNRAAFVGRVRITWRDGVVIENVRLKRREGFGDGWFLTVGRIRCDFTPLRSLVTGKVNSLSAENLDCWVVLNEKGELNIGDLNDRGGARLPTYQYRVSDAVVHIENQQDVGTLQDFEIGSFVCQLDPQTGRATYQVDARVASFDGAPAETGADGSRFRVNGGMTLPTLQRKVNLAGGGTFTWDRLDLSTFPIRWLPMQAGRRMAGSSTGKIQVEVGADLGINFAVETTVAGLRVYEADDTLRFGLDAATLTTRGRWDPTADDLMLDKVELDVPGLVWLEGGADGGPPVRLGQRVEEPVRVQVAGVLRDPADLFRRIVSDPGMKTSGPCRFDLTYSRRLTQQSIVLGLDADRLSLEQKDGTSWPAGFKKQVALSAVLDEAKEELRIGRLDGTWGSLNMAAQAVLPVPKEEYSNNKDAMNAMLARGRLQARVRVEEPGRWTQEIPALPRLLPELSISGATVAMVDYRSLDDAGRLTADVQWSRDSDVSYGRLLHKNPGEILHAWTDVEIPLGTSGRIRSFQVALEHGNGRLRLKSGDGGLRYAVPRAGPAEETTGFSGVGGSAERSEAVEASASQTLHLAGAVTWRAESIESWLPVSPLLADRLIRDNKPLVSGHAGGEFDFDADLSVDRALCRIHADVEADDLSVVVPEGAASGAHPVWTKSGHQRGQLAVDYLLDHATTTVHELQASAVLDGMRVWIAGRTSVSGDSQKAGAMQWQHLLERADVRLQVLDVQSGLAYWPVLREWSERNGLAGGLQLDMHFDGAPQNPYLHWDLDAGALAFALPGEDLPRKRAGLPSHVSGTLVIDETGSQESPKAVVRLQDMEGTFASCKIRVAEGRLCFSEGWDGLSASLADGRLRSELLSEAALTLRSTCVFDASLRDVSPVVERMAARYDLIGSAEVEASYGYGTEGHRIEFIADASRTHFQVLPHFVKSVGEPLSVRGRFRGADPTDRDASPGITVEAVDVALGDMRAEARGRIDWGSGGLLTLSVSGYELDGSMTVPDLSSLSRLTPRWASLEASGSLSLEGSVAGGRDGFEVRAMHARLGGTQLKLSGRWVTVDGGLDLTGQDIRLDHLSVGIDRSRFEVAGRVQGPPDRVQARLAVHAEDFDYDGLRRFLAELPASDEPSVETSDQVLRKLLLHGRSADVDVDYMADHMTVTARGGEIHRISALSGRAVVRNAVCDLPFRCSMNGGVIEGTFRLPLDQDDPAFDLQYTAFDVEAAPNTRPIIEDFFVGMTVEGKMSIIDSTHQYLFDKPGRLNYPVGSGEMIIERGTVEGRAAPLAVTRIFPQLNLARYRFDRMRNWFVKYADGRHDNRMIFTGSPYNLYMDGYSTEEGRIHYEIGIDLLAGYDSKYWAESGQGRIPLFTKDGQVGPNKKLISETVNYLPPWRIADILLVKNNVVYTAYLALRKSLTESK